MTSAGKIEVKNTCFTNIEVQFYHELSQYKGGILRKLATNELVGRIKDYATTYPKNKDLHIYCEWTISRKAFASSWHVVTAASRKEYFNVMYDEILFINPFIVHQLNIHDVPMLIIAGGIPYILYKASHDMSKENWESLLPKDYFDKLVGKL